MGTKAVKLSSIKPSPYNPRVALKPGDPEYEKLKRSIEEFGCVEPLLVNKRTGNLVGGHQRFGVLKDLGYESVDVVLFQNSAYLQVMCLQVAELLVDSVWSASRTVP